MTVAEISDVLDVQEAGAVRALSNIFPQDAYPFPRELLATQWSQEFLDPAVDCYVIVVADVVAGFAAVRGNEFVHFGTAVDQWGNGLATRAHDEVIRRIERDGYGRAWLTVLADNPRARRFYEKHGWRATGKRSRDFLPPHPELVHYDRDVPSCSRPEDRNESA